MERPGTVGELLDAYHASLRAGEEGDRTWVDVKFAVAEAMDQENVAFFHHAPSGTFYWRTADDLIVSPCRDAATVPLAPYIARSIAPVYDRLRAELDVWLGWERRDSDRVTFRDAEGVERTCRPEPVDVTGGVFRVRRVALSNGSVAETRPGWVAVAPIGRRGAPPASSPLFYVRADQIMPAPTAGG